MTQALDDKGMAIPGTSENADGSVVVTLFRPIKVMNDERATLTIARPLAKHLRAMDEAKGTVEASLRLIQKLANIPQPSVDELDGSDVARIGKVIAGFTGLSLPNGDG
jgi:hypothetical protein